MSDLFGMARLKMALCNSIGLKSMSLMLQNNQCFQGMAWERALRYKMGHMFFYLCIGLVDGFSVFSAQYI